MDKEKFLPIGTIVLLKGGKKRVMITSYLIVPRNEIRSSKMFDYGGCLFPEGIIDASASLGFNHNQIQEIIYMGLEDEEEKKFIEALDKVCVGLREKLEKEFDNS